MTWRRKRAGFRNDRQQEGRQPCRGPRARPAPPVARALSPRRGRAARHALRAAEAWMGTRSHPATLAWWRGASQLPGQSPPFTVVPAAARPHVPGELSSPSRRSGFVTQGALLSPAEHSHGWPALFGHRSRHTPARWQGPRAGGLLLGPGLGTAVSVGGNAWLLATLRFEQMSSRRRKKIPRF